MPDRDRVYREVARVLKSSGRIAFYDVVAAGGDTPPFYPVPWAEIEATSFLMNERPTHRAFAVAGFTLDTWSDVTECAKVACASSWGSPPRGRRLRSP